MNLAENDDALSSWMSIQRVVYGLAILALASLVLQHGFAVTDRVVRWLNWIDAVLAIGFGFVLLRRIAAAKRWRDAVQKHRVELVVAAVLASAVLLVQVMPSPAVAKVLSAFRQDTVGDLTFGFVRLFLLANVGIQLLQIFQGLFLIGLRAEIVFAGSFAALIGIGTLLLLLPRAGADSSAPLSRIDALFTATSAACVTGLVVRDTGTEFSPLGQMIIMALFQIGGLGVVTFVALVSAFSTKSLPVPQMVAFRQIISAPGMNDLKRRIVGIVVLTTLIEGAGAVSLYAAGAPGGDLFEKLKWSVFHSISAFCNAGFALQSDSLEFARRDVAVNWIIMVLIVLGGLGFLVLPELISKAKGMVRRSIRFIRPARHRFYMGYSPHLTVQTRLSLRVTILLIMIGLAGFWILEAKHTLSGSSAADAFLTSAFQSITARTAGFNSVPIGTLQQSTLILIVALMVIGGCPVSTAGGIKTVTFGVLFLAMRSLIGQRTNVEAFGRTLPSRAFLTALNVLVFYLAAAGMSLFLLTVLDPQIPLRDAAFETISALSTVGLSTGITADLSTGSKLVLCASMFIGRVGPIALVFAVFQARGKADYEFPKEDVVVG